jgi:hypothetical protein
MSGVTNFPPWILHKHTDCLNQNKEIKQLLTATEERYKIASSINFQGNVSTNVQTNLRFMHNQNHFTFPVANWYFFFFTKKMNRRLCMME